MKRGRTGSPQTEKGVRDNPQTGRDRSGGDTAPGGHAHGSSDQGAEASRELEIQVHLKVKTKEKELKTE